LEAKKHQICPTHLEDSPALLPSLPPTSYIFSLARVGPISLMPQDKISTSTYTPT
jgi:hypothetical protein